MRTAIISDLHSNLEALLAVLKDIGRAKCDRIICLGDVINYGAQPNEVIAELEKNKIPTLLGNHDQYAKIMLNTPGIDYTGDFFGLRDESIMQSLNWTVKKLNDKSKTFLEKVKDPILTEGSVTYAHSSPREGWEYIYPPNNSRSEIPEGAEIFQAFDKLCFVGHTHVPGYTWQNGEKFPYRMVTGGGAYKIARKLLVTVGSAGQPRDGDVRATYVIYDSANNQVDFRKVFYNTQKTANSIIAAGLSSRHAERLFRGE